jgi:hypothetical protein
VIQLAPASMQEVIRGLQALRGIAHLSRIRNCPPLSDAARISSCKPTS